MKIIFGYQDTRTNNEDFAITPYLFGVWFKGSIIRVIGCGLCWGYHSIFIGIVLGLHRKVRIKLKELKDAIKKNDVDSVRHLPEQSPRVETGSVKFGDDWTGVFIRGDNALWYGYMLSEMLKDEINPIDEIMLKDLTELLLKAKEK